MFYCICRSPESPPSPDNSAGKETTNKNGKGRKPKKQNATIQPSPETVCSYRTYRTYVRSSYW